MKRFIAVMYWSLYDTIGISFLLLEYTSIRISWPWLQTLVLPMGYVFLAINIPIASIAVLKIGHVTYLHSKQHHHNVMRSIRQADYQAEILLANPPTLVEVTPVKTAKDEPVSTLSRTTGTLAQNILSQNVPLSQGVKSDNVKVAAYLADYPGASIREVERNTGVSRSNVGRTPAWQNR